MSTQNTKPEKNLLEMTEEERQEALCRARERFASWPDGRVADGFYSLLTGLSDIFYQIFTRDFPNGGDFSDRWILACYYWQELLIAKEEREKRKVLRPKVVKSEPPSWFAEYDDFRGPGYVEFRSRYRKACHDLENRLENISCCEHRLEALAFSEAEKAWECVKKIHGEFERKFGNGGEEDA